MVGSCALGARIVWDGMAQDGSGYNVWSGSSYLPCGKVLAEFQGISAMKNSPLVELFSLSAAVLLLALSSRSWSCGTYAVHTIASAFTRQAHWLRSWRWSTAWHKCLCPDAGVAATRNLLLLDPYLIRRLLLFPCFWSRRVLISLLDRSRSRH